MVIQSLSGAWRMRRTDESTWREAVVPGSVCADLMRCGVLPDPFFRENEFLFLDAMEKDYVYTRTFIPSEQLLSSPRIRLRCFGVDTLAAVSLNGRDIGRCDNMHVVFAFDIRSALTPGENTLTFTFSSPIAAARKAYREDPMWEIGRAHV